MLFRLWCAEWWLRVKPRETRNVGVKGKLLLLGKIDRGTAKRIKQHSTVYRFSGPGLILVEAAGECR